MTRRASPETPATERVARATHKEKPHEIFLAYLLFVLAGLLIIGAAYGVWLLLTRIF